MPKAADYRERARASLQGKWGMAVLICFIASLLGGIGSSSPVTLTMNVQDVMAGSGYGNMNLGVEMFGIPLDTGYLPSEMMALLTMALGVAVIYTLVQFIVGSVVELGVCAYFSKLALGMDANVSDEFAYFKYFWKALGLRFVTLVFIFLWSLLLLFPGVIAAYRYSMATYILAEHPEMGIMEALAASKQMMVGNKWSEFCLEFSFIGWALLSACTCGIGILFLNPYMQMSKAHFYMTLSRGSGNTAQQ